MGFTRRWIFGLTHKYILEMCAEGENKWSTHAFVYGFTFSFFALLTSLLTTYFPTSFVKPCFMMTKLNMAIPGPTIHPLTDLRCRSPVLRRGDSRSDCRRGEV